MSMPSLPGGTLRPEKGDTIAVTGKGGALQVTCYDLFGIDTTPETMLLDAQGRLFARASLHSVLVREGYEGEEVRLRKLAADWGTQRFVTIPRSCQFKADASRPTARRSLKAAA